MDQTTLAADWPVVVQAAAQAQQEAAAMGHLLDPTALRLSRQTAALLLSWGIDPLPAVAALLAPLLHNPAAGAAPPAATHGAAAMELAAQLVSWQAANTAAAEGSAPVVDQYSVQQRQLFRQAYLDHPHFHFPLLALADHQARYSEATLISPALAEQTRQVFIPVATMLGLRRLRRAWTDQSTAVLDPDSYAVVKAPNWPWSVAAKAGDCALLEQRLRDLAAREGPVPAFTLDLKLPNTLQTTRLYKEKASPEDIVRWLGVRVLCESVPDCYRLLGLIHRLGRPATPRFTAHFADYIAAPKPTGYQALHTAIHYSDAAPASAQSGAFAHESLIEFRILTRTMDDLNEWGVIAAMYHHPAVYGDTAAWWNGLNRLLRQITKRAQETPATATIQELLRRYDLGSTSDPLYLFTPLGEIVLLVEGSSPMDFAYRIHSDLSRQATHITVNGQDVPLNYPLRNGDLVEVHSNDPLVTPAERPAGPDLAWLGVATTPNAKRRIRRGLLRRAAEQHPGRHRILTVLIKLLDYYATVRHYPLTITTQRLDTFLRAFAETRSLAGLDALYTAVAEEHIAPDGLMRRLIALELATALMTGTGERLPYPAHLIRFCDLCRPVPGDRLLALERRKGSALPHLVLHRQGYADCPGVRAPGRRVAVRWSSPAKSVTTRELALLEITAEDRAQLLDDILAVIYREPTARLYQVHAHAYSNGGADITLALEADSLTQLVAMQAGIGQVPHVQRVTFLPPSSAQRLTFQSPAYKRLINPYTTQEVYDRWMFHDREQPVAAISDWLAETGPTQPLILHGHRRVGKSSLARYLEYEVLPPQGQVVAVFVDLHGFSDGTPERFAAHLVDRIAFSLNRQGAFVPPPRRADEDPILWLERALVHAVAHLRGKRLLLMLDEFNALIEREPRKRVNPVLFRNLRSVMHAHRDVKWLLIVQEVQYQDPLSWGSAGVLLQETRQIGLDYLAADWARKLILGPAQRCGYTYADADLPDQILHLTQGSPYLIQIVCFHLVERARTYNRTNLTQEDLDQAVKETKRQGGGYLHHFIEHLTPFQRSVLAALAHTEAAGAWVDTVVLAAQIRPRMRGQVVHRLEAALVDLHRRGMIARRTTGALAQVSIPLGLFHAWIRHALSVAGAPVAGPQEPDLH